ncbi:MAG: DUF5683 domain-containing protein [Bacteroidia bacterium]|nr:DUF5683 domain-containing protein [Bacteroidia bacterium]MDW8134225.1 DUF5683 domain-containing protein [Bacteroidia bacterium]
MGYGVILIALMQGVGKGNGAYSMRECSLCITDSVNRPRIAAWLSALLPGAGQIYNRAYWKAPIIWAALGVTGYLAYRHHQSYLAYRKAYREALEGNNPLPSIPPENLRFLRESYRKDRDVLLLAFFVVYGLQIGEAYADAHLRGFSIYGGLSPGGFVLLCQW